LQNNHDARISRDGLRALNVSRCACNFVCEGIRDAVRKYTINIHNCTRNTFQMQKSRKIDSRLLLVNW